MRYKLRLTNKQDKAKIEKLEVETKDTRPEGLLELFWELENKGTATSLNKARIYYLGYLMSDRGIEFEITEG